MNEQEITQNNSNGRGLVNCNNYSFFEILQVAKNEREITQKNSNGRVLHPLKQREFFMGSMPPTPTNQKRSQFAVQADARGDADQDLISDPESSLGKPVEQQSQPLALPDQNYIHSKKRMVQSTDKYGLAERVRREKINERMKLLIDLVPGCNKLRGNALVLDETINYVQSLQRQVEFLSMKLGPAHPRKMTVERIFAAINFLLELPSAVLDQLSSEPKPLFALMLLFLSFVALVICIIELVHKGTREKVTSKLISIVPRRHLRKNPFCSFSNIVGLTCAFCQCIFTTVNYAMVLRQRNIQIQVSVMPIVFAFVLLCSKFWSDPKQTESEAEEA